METKQFDVVVIGGGPGGYPAAIKAAQNGKKVALVEAKELGGTCLNRGCIPSKALIADAEMYQNAKNGTKLGILSGSVGFNFAQMVKHKNDVVLKMRKSLEGLIASNQITVVKGYGKFISPKEIKVMGEENVILQTEKTIIATGSEPRYISAFPFDYKKVHDSTSLLAAQSLPKSIVIIGGGVIGCEFASLYANLDVQVTILEMMPRLIPMEDKGVSEFLRKSFQKKSVVIQTEARVAGIDTTEKGVSVRLEQGSPVTADIALVAVGRQLNTTDIGLEKAGVLVQDNGVIQVNEQMETNVPGIYAIGDITSNRWWLAHVATHQGVVAASNAIGIPAHMNYRAIPSVIFTNPEIATVGLNLEDALAQGYQATLGAFPFQALGKAQAAFHTDGFAQIVLDKRTGQILGAQVVGYEASTLIAEMTVAIANELTIECIAETIHAHPTMAEAWLEAALVGMGTPLHLLPKRKT
ncbi:MAG: dihydrolipoyl dehydrogenase [Parachlamydiaceae bacterium]|nr:dihydrolipoyl dehydrogenase [Parachlamydiaceae bacterium]